MRNSLLGMLLFLSGCGGSTSGPVQPPKLSADQEQAIMEQMKQSSEREGAASASAPQP